jgi:hypothetical protein
MADAKFKYSGRFEIGNPNRRKSNAKSQRQPAGHFVSALKVARVQE